MRKFLVGFMISLVIIIGVIVLMILENASSDRDNLSTSSDSMLSDGYVVERIHYTTNSIGARMYLDLYTDGKQLKKTPVLIYIHGGAWWSNDKNAILIGERKRILQELVKKGYAVISINYQLVSPHYNIELPIIDTKDAIRWVHRNADTYGFNDGNIGLWGCSAGGHLAMMASYSFDKDFIGNPDLANYSSKVKYVISYSGPVDLVNSYEFQGKFDVYPDFEECDNISYVTGVPLAEENLEKTITKLREYSPIEWMGPHCVPTLAIIGENDDIVPVEQIDLMQDLFSNYGIADRFSYMKAENATHCLLTDDYNSDELKNEIVERTLLFILSFK